MDPIIHFNEPIYCDTYVSLMVEDLTLCYHPATLHYGKCSMIGRIANDVNSHCLYLESLKITKLEGCVLPDGFTRILLSTDSFDKPITLNKGVEVFGEVMLRKKNSSKLAQSNPIETSKSLIIALGYHYFESFKKFVKTKMFFRKYQQFCEKERNLPERKPTGMGDKSMNSKIRLNLQRILEKQKSEYEPVLVVHSVSFVDEPRELIACNLKLKLLRMSMGKEIK